MVWYGAVRIADFFGGKLALFIGNDIKSDNFALLGARLF